MSVALDLTGRVALRFDRRDGLFGQGFGIDRQLIGDFSPPVASSRGWLEAVAARGFEHQRRRTVLLGSNILDLRVRARKSTAAPRTARPAERDPGNFFATVPATAEADQIVEGPARHVGVDQFDI